jgi:hypothetical protein
MAPPLSNVVVFGPETNTFTVNLLRAFHGAGVSAALLSVSRDLDDPRGSSPPTAKRIARIVRASTVPLIMVGNFLVAGLVNRGLAIVARAQSFRRAQQALWRTLGGS